MYIHLYIQLCGCKCTVIIMYTLVRYNIFDKGKNVLFSDQKCSELKLRVVI